MAKMVMYDSILARSFSRHEQKKLRYGAFVCCLLIALCFCTVLKPNLNPLPACMSIYVFSEFSLCQIFFWQPSSVSYKSFKVAMLSILISNFDMHSIMSQ